VTGPRQRTSPEHQPALGATHATATPPGNKSTLRSACQAMHAPDPLASGPTDAWVASRVRQGARGGPCKSRGAGRARGRTSPHALAPIHKAAPPRRAPSFAARDSVQTAASIAATADLDFPQGRSPGA
jgi:hypothetical protein